MSEGKIGRRTFVAQAGAMGAALAVAGSSAHGESANGSQRVRVGVIGCGSVSRAYLPNLSKSPHVKLVSTCDIIEDRAKTQAEAHKIPNYYGHIDAMLGGEEFDLLVNLTDMQEHERLNRQAIEAGKHVWSEKPIANSYEAGERLLKLAIEKQRKLWCAPVTVASPAFAFMAKTLAAGKLGKVAAAHGEYGHTGPNWSDFFYNEGGGSLPDLGVYNLTTLTGLLGPVKSVSAMTSIVTPVREIKQLGEVEVTAEDNAMVLMDHGNGVISHVQSGFNYFNPSRHDDGSGENRHTIRILGSSGGMGMVGYDWEPHGVDLRTRDQTKTERFATDNGDYEWEMGASLAAECLATGRDLLVTPEHALHVLEIIQSARKSQETGQRVVVRSDFKWPVIG